MAIDKTSALREEQLGRYATADALLHWLKEKRKKMRGKRDRHYIDLIDDLIYTCLDTVDAGAGGDGLTDELSEFLL